MRQTIFKLKAAALVLAGAGLAVPAFAQVPIIVNVPTDPNTAVIAQNTGQIAQTSAQILQQQINDANTRAQQLQEAIKQTAHQQSILEQQHRTNAGYNKPGEFAFSRAVAESQKVMEQMNQMQALSHVYSDLVTAFDTRYPGAKDALPEGYDLNKFRNDMVNWAWTVQANAKGLMLANQEAARHWEEQDAIARTIESNWNENLTPGRTLQMLMMLTAENLRQMSRLRQETANFTSTMSSWLAGQAQKEINAIRLAQTAKPNGDPNYAGIKTDPTKGFWAPQQLGWEFKSPFRR